MTHQNRRVVRRLAVFFFACMAPAGVALVAAQLGMQTPRWLPLASILCATPAATLLEVVLEHPRKNACGARCSPTS
jgi:hypothetical protein